LSQLSNEIGDNLVNAILKAEQKTEADIWDQRERIVILKHKLQEILNADEHRYTQIEQKYPR